VVMVMEMESNYREIMDGMGDCKLCLVAQCNGISYRFQLKSTDIVVVI
jgi:hypothetical protein